MASSVTARLVEHMARVLERLRLKDQRLLLAVSGGVDSMALSYLVSQIGCARNCIAITVDHGFRPESAHEADQVAEYMQKLGIRHETKVLVWASSSSSSSKANDGLTNYKTSAMPPVQRLEEIARQRRYTEIADACQRYKISAVLTGHHASDQAETFLLRFMRMSGISGLAGMSEQTMLPFALQNAVNNAWGKQHERVPLLVRPLLSVKKEELYDVCKAQGIRWYEDASNADNRFRRNQLRQIIKYRSDQPESPVNTDALLQMRGFMQRHREYIDKHVSRLLGLHAKYDMVLATIELSSAPVGLLPEWARNPALCERVLARVIAWVGSSSSSSQAPELAHLAQFMQTVTNHQPNQTKAVSAAGVTMLPPTTRRGWLFCRQPPRQNEIAASSNHLLGTSTLWDKRLVVSVSEHKSRPSNVLSWSVLGLDDAIKLFGSAMSSHRHWLKQKRQLIAPSYVLASSPVVCVQYGDVDEPRLVFALGYAVEHDEGVVVSVRPIKPV
ncbi:hypothetical protein FB645_002325 [Coemansia sp. IMI 203386]|nr:hypothetical protein FB645_002325 [Coemansia sp. IMI 203386]